MDNIDMKNLKRGYKNLVDSQMVNDLINEIMEKAESIFGRISFKASKIFSFDEKFPVSCYCNIELYLFISNKVYERKNIYVTFYKHNENRFKTILEVKEELYDILIKIRDNIEV